VDRPVLAIASANAASRRRLISRLAAGIASSAYLMLESDPTLVVRDFVANMEQVAKRIATYQQQKRRTGKQRLDERRQEEYARKVEHLAQMAGGLLATAGVLKQDLPTVAEMPDLILHIADELEQIAQTRVGCRKCSTTSGAENIKCCLPRGSSGWRQARNERLQCSPANPVRACRWSLARFRDISAGHSVVFALVGDGGTLYHECICV